MRWEIGEEEIVKIHGDDGAAIGGTRDVLLRFPRMIGVTGGACYL